MKIQNTPGSYGFLAGCLVLLLGLIANASCAHVPRMPDDAQAQHAPGAVEVYTECGSGSGVLVDSTHVLTAFHVVDCSSDDTPKIARWIVVRTLDKVSSVAFVDVPDGERDLARLTLTAMIPNVQPVRIRSARVGETICVVAARPERTVKCGQVDRFSGPRSWGDVILKGASVWYGNSGSGVYGVDGALVGIAVRLEWCNAGDALYFGLTNERIDTCGGRVSSIHDSPVSA